MTATTLHILFLRTTFHQPLFHSSITETRLHCPFPPTHSLTLPLNGTTASTSNLLSITTMRETTLLLLTLNRPRTKQKSATAFKKLPQTTQAATGPTTKIRIGVRSDSSLTRGQTESINWESPVSLLSRLCQNQYLSIPLASHRNPLNLVI